jgi:chromosomal replication initiator protein
MVALESTLPDSPVAAIADVQQHWERVRARLRALLGNDLFSSWFARLELDTIDADTVRLSAPTRFLKSWIVAHYAPQVLACWQEEQSSIQHIDVRVRSVERPAKAEPPAGKAPSVPTAKDATARRAAPAREDDPVRAPDALDRSLLDARFTLDSFIVDMRNQVSHAAARQIAGAESGDPLMFNPVYLHAGVGLGKTHLLQGIAWASRRKVTYVTAERFMYGFVSAARQGTLPSFRDRLRAAELLLIDDVHFLQGKAMMAELGRTLDAVMQAGRQVVLVGNVPLAELDHCEEHTRSQLSGGLAIALGPLDRAGRLRLLHARVEAAARRHPSFSVAAPVLAFLADNIATNGRDLDGAVNHLLAQHALAQQAITLTLAETIVRSMLRPAEPKKIRIEDIQRMVARHFNIARGDMLSSRRTANVVGPRQIAMYLAKVMTLRSLPEIGRRFGGRDHTTVLHAVRKIEELAKRDEQMSAQIESLKQMVLEI